MFTLLLMTVVNITSGQDYGGCDKSIWLFFYYHHLSYIAPGHIDLIFLNIRFCFDDILEILQNYLNFLSLFETINTYIKLYSILQDKLYKIML